MVYGGRQTDLSPWKNFHLRKSSVNDDKGDLAYLPSMSRGTSSKGIALESPPNKGTWESPIPVFGGSPMNGSGAGGVETQRDVWNISERTLEDQHYNQLLTYHGVGQEFLLNFGG